MSWKLFILAIVSLVVAIARPVAATPPPENRPQFCAMFFCAEVVAYSPVEGAVIERSGAEDSVTIRLEDGTTASFSSRAATVSDVEGAASVGWTWISQDSAEATMCVGCSDPVVPSHFLTIVVTGDKESVRQHLQGSFCVWSARYKYRPTLDDRPLLELGQRQCAPRQLRNFGQDA